MFLRIFSICSSVYGAYGFVSPAIHGPVGDHYNMYAVPRHTAYKMLKTMEIESIVANSPGQSLDEIHLSREMCRDYDKWENLFISVIKENDKKKPEYVLLYRKSKPTARKPTVYTIESMIVNTEISPNLSMSNVLDILESFCKNNRGYLQVYPLKNWSKGRYFSGIALERSMELS